MPRIRQNAQQYAKADFLKEIRIRQGEFDLMTQTALSAAVGIPQPTMCKRMRDPDTITIPELRQIVQAIKPDAAVVLTWLGYTSKDIKRLAGGNNNAGTTD